MTPTKRRELEALLSGWLDDDLDAMQMAKLDEWLRTDAEARQLHRRFAAMHVDLVEDRPVEAAVADALKGLPDPGELPKQYSAMRFKLHVFQGLAAAMAVLCGVVWYVYANRAPVVETVEVAAPIPAVLVGEIIESKKAIWSDGESRPAGRLLHATPLSLDSGSVTILFDSGAVVYLEGPTSISLESSMNVRLNSGRLAARVPISARGFSVDAPRAAVVDLGTEFAMDVSDLGITDLMVYSGEVEASLLDAEAGTLRNALVGAGEGVRINSTDGTLTGLRARGVDFLKVPHASASGLRAEDAYAAEVKRDEPMGYWRFDRADGRVVANEMGTRYAGRMLGSADLARSGRRALSFPDDRQGGFIVDDLLENVNAGGFTMEAWVNPAALENMALVSIVDPTPDGSKGHKHLAYLELTGAPYARRHKKYDVRFLHRYPASAGFGSNTYAGISYRAGEWYHLVGVRELDRLVLYVNGEKRKEIAVSDAGDDAAYRFFVGQIDPTRMMRGFTGQIDELALYNKALTHDDVRRHYEAIQQ